MSTNMIAIEITLNRALVAHRNWKTLLREAAAKGESLDAATIKRDDCCDLGRWLQSSGRTLYGHKPEFTDLLKKHNHFHSIAGMVAAIINSGDMEAAQTHLGSNSQYSTASNEVGLSIMVLKAAVSGAKCE